MARRGFIHDKLDIKMLELYLLSRAAGAIAPETLADLVMRHEGAEYFDFAEATAELVDSGHLELTDGCYAITERGRVNSQACESSLPYSVRQRCDQDLMQINAALRREALVQGETRANGDGSAVARMALNDEKGNLLTVELLCPSEEQAAACVARFRARPEEICHEILSALTGPEKGGG